MDVGSGRSDRRISTAPMPSQSATACRAGAIATTPVATITSTAAAMSSARAPGGAGSDEPAAQRGGRLLRRRVVEVLGQVGERALEVDHSVTSSPSAVRRRSSARDSRDFAVPNGHDNTSAVSLSLSPPKKRRATTSRWCAGSSLTAATSRRRSSCSIASVARGADRRRLRANAEVHCRPPRHRTAPVPRFRWPRS